MTNRIIEQLISGLAMVSEGVRNYRNENKYKMIRTKIRNLSLLGDVLLIGGETFSCLITTGTFEGDCSLN